MVEEQDIKLKRFLEKVRKKFDPEKVLLFGSRARGNHLESSDYDILIISEKFGGMNFRDRIIKAYELIDEPLNVEILCYTLEEFNEKSKELCVVKKAAEEGITLI